VTSTVSLPSEAVESDGVPRAVSGRKDASIALAIVVLPHPCTPVTTIHAGGAASVGGHGRGRRWSAV
jgi:hypothetical protein